MLGNKTQWFKVTRLQGLDIGIANVYSLSSVHECIELWETILQTSQEHGSELWG